MLIIIFILIHGDLIMDKVIKLCTRTFMPTHFTTVKYVNILLSGTSGGLKVGYKGISMRRKMMSSCQSWESNLRALI